MAKKYYVVWEGRDKGVFDSWAECKSLVDGYAGAKYKSFESKEAAYEAFRSSYWDVVKGVKKVERMSPPASLQPGLAVDAACSGNPGRMEYRGVAVPSGEELFHSTIYHESTNNIGEFLALVHGLSYLKKLGHTCPIYSDSVSAISWVRAKKCKSQLQQTERNVASFEMIARAENWLRSNSFETRIVKWDTEHWGEIPADFGRK